MKGETMKTLTKNDFKKELRNADDLMGEYGSLCLQYPLYQSVLLKAMTEVMLEKAGI
jgi:BarA-like signal transduction histidine kinase